MFEVFKQYLERMMPRLSGEEIKLICTNCTIKKLRRRENLLQEGEVCRHKIFVSKGLLRNYSRADNGYEYVMRFTDAGGWTTDPESYSSGIASTFNIDAIEPSELILCSRDNFEGLKQSVPALNAFSEAVMTQSLSITQKRVLLSLSATAEEKYIHFINNFPSIFHRVPLYMVASYLGLSRETLTRVRQGLLVSKAR